MFCITPCHFTWGLGLCSAHRSVFPPTPPPVGLIRLTITPSPGLGFPGQSDSPYLITISWITIPREEYYTIHELSNGQENAENTAENNAYSTPIEDTAQFHKQNQERRRVKCDFFKRAIKLSYLNLWYAMDTTSS